MSERKERCDDCKFWLPDKGSPAAPGECHRNPPSVVVSQMPREYWFAGPCEGVWPETLAHFWCGEWQARAEGQTSGRKVTVKPAVNTSGRNCYLCPSEEHLFSVGNFSQFSGYVLICLQCLEDLGLEPK